MKLPVQITYRHCQETEAITQFVRYHASRLDQFCRDIMGCRVCIEEPHHHRKKGKLYHVRIDLTVPGREIIVKRDPALHAAHKDVYVAIRDAFFAARRQLEDFVRNRRRDVKHHEPASRGQVVRLFPYDDYGFIQTPDGREIYFHRNSVLNDQFGRVEIGTRVRFREEAGDNGPQASTVHLSSRRN